jgi:hypothetical protein
MAQAQALLEWLQARYPGDILRASDVECICYGEMLKERNCRPRPWVGRHGVGKYLKTLTGGKKRSTYWPNENGDTERVRTYLIPHSASNVIQHRRA